MINWKIVFFGTLDCLTIVTDSPQKQLYVLVNWFDVRKMSSDSCDKTVKELIRQKNNVWFDGFGDLSLTIGQYIFGYNEAVTSSPRHPK